MEMLNPHCGIDRDGRGVVRLSICNAGSLNILSSAVTDGVREGFEKLAGDREIRAVILAGQSEKSMIGGADIKEMARLDQKSAEAFITRLRDLCEAVRKFPAPVIARLPGWCLGGACDLAMACDMVVAAEDAPGTQAAFASTVQDSKERTSLARECVDQSGVRGPNDVLIRLIEAQFEGTPAYIGVYSEGPGAGQAPDHIVVFVVAKGDCRILSTASQRISSG